MSKLETFSHITVRGVNKIFKSSDREVVALKDIELDIPQGQFVCLLGPSGCGKSTLLNAIAGFSLPSSGAITADGRAVTGPGPERGMVFQEYALFPWMTVEKNIAFGLEIKRLVPARGNRPRAGPRFADHADGRTVWGTRCADAAQPSR
jgi:NitT/TauT family transport system ATP-binding protein